MESLCYSLAIVVVLFQVAFAQTGLSTEDRQEMLDAHNYFRARVSPTATNMERMVWNDELAEVAQQYADNCVFDHNDDRSSQSDSFSYVGENLYIISSQSVNYTSHVESWYNEVQDYTYSTNQCSDVCGHYTQVVWAASNSLGCGAYRCAQVQGFSPPNSLNVVCNYGPGGNINGARPYLTGGSICSQCPTDKPLCQSNLCSDSSSVGMPTTSDGDGGTNAASVGMPTTSDGDGGTNAASVGMPTTSDGDGGTNAGLTIAQPLLIPLILAIITFTL